MAIDLPYAIQVALRKAVQESKRKAVPLGVAQHRHATDALCRGDFGTW